MDKWVVVFVLKSDPKTIYKEQVWASCERSAISKALTANAQLMDEAPSASMAFQVSEIHDGPALIVTGKNEYFWSRDGKTHWQGN